MMSAAASLGVSLLWDTDVGLSHVDKYTYSAEEHIKVGDNIFFMYFFDRELIGWCPSRYRNSQHWGSD
jgi:hypothetical protein